MGTAVVAKKPLGQEKYEVFFIIGRIGVFTGLLMRDFCLRRDFRLLKGQISKVQVARRLLVCIGSKLLTQVIKELARGGSPAVLPRFI